MEDLHPLFTGLFQPPKDDHHVPSGTRIHSHQFMKKSVHDYSNKQIWTDDEIGICPPPQDSRQRPEYSIQYGTRIASEDLYLGINGKQPNSYQDADQLIVKIQLPLIQSFHSDNGKNAFSVDVSNDSILNLRSDDYYLSVPLPKKVDNDMGVAKWDPNTKTLVLELPINKDYSSPFFYLKN